MPVAIPTRKIIVDGLLVNIAYLEGSSEATPLFLLHGWGCDSSIWNKVVPLLKEKNVPVYIWDAPGFGQSQTPPTAFTITDYCNVLEQVVEKLDLHKVHLVGHSFGGRISIKIAAQNPTWLETLILVDAAGIPHKTHLTKAKILLSKLFKPLFQLSILHGVRSQIYKMMGAEEYIATPELQRTFTNIVDEDLSIYLSQITKPSLIIWGKEDENEYTPVRDAYTTQSQIKNAQLSILSPAGHFSFIDQSEKFVQNVLQFIDKRNYV